MSVQSNRPDIFEMLKVKKATTLNIHDADQRIGMWVVLNVHLHAFLMDRTIIWNEHDVFE